MEQQTFESPRRDRFTSIVVIDSSALVAILLEEEEAATFAALIGGARHRLVSTLSFVETSIVVRSRYGTSGLETLDELIHENGIVLKPFTDVQARIAYANST